MYAYAPPLRDYRFVLHETFRIHEDAGVAGYDELTPDITDAILDEAGRIAREVLAPINATGDREGCVLENGVVRAPRGFREAYDLMRDGGWPGLECDPDFGGQGMPSVLSLSVGTLKSAANMAAMMYHGLTHGAYSALHEHGSPEQKALYLPKLASGRWMGTMNLTEPQCGTDLGLVRTRAEPREDGSWSITGTKIWISSGEHDLADNIVHLVLARTPAGQGKGTRGLSLFVVPKFVPDADGEPGPRNGVSCVGIEEKMGLHGNATCAMAYDGAQGWMVGEECRGLAHMFTMMNEARLLVGMQGLAIAQGAYTQAVGFARERLQGRAVTGPENPDGPADPIIVHPDVRRMLMEQKSFVEGGIGFLAWVCMALDAEKRHGDAEVRARMADRVALLTPVVKAFLTEEGFRMTTLAQQVFGGAGYVEDTGVAQYVRDARITMVYEGTTGIQALDLVGRKLGQNGGRAIRAFFDDVKGFLATLKEDEQLHADFGEPLKAASKDLQEAATVFASKGMKEPNAALAGSVDFTMLFGHVCMGLAWARMARAAKAALDAGRGDAAYYEAKLATGRFYMARTLPETGLRLARIRSGAEPVMALPAEAF